MKQRRGVGSSGNKPTAESPILVNLSSKSTGHRETQRATYVVGTLMIGSLFLAVIFLYANVFSKPTSIHQSSRSSLNVDAASSRSELPHREIGAVVSERKSRDETERTGEERKKFDPEETSNSDRGGVLEVLKCPTGLPSPSQMNLTQKCCEFRPGKFSCLPNLVVMGAQKSGTTTVHSYLLFHPWLRPAKKKEMHLFDFDKNFVVLKERVTTLIPGVPKEDIGKELTIDSTPSYIADHKACPRMAKILSPDARFVLILRDPVERTWSDLLMKRRRVESQTEFLKVILPKYHKEILTCLNKCGSDCSTPKFRECLPREVASHGRITAFLKFIRTGSREAIKFKRKCLTTEETTLKCIEGEFEDAILREKMPPVPDVLFKEAKYLRKQLEECCAHPNATSSKPPLKRQKGFRDKLPTEITDAELEEYLNDDNDPWYPDSGDEYGFCRGCGCRCFPRSAMISDVSKHHLWRSLYFPQLVHCFASITKDRILIINNSDLRRDPQGTMLQVWSHIGVPKIDLTKVTPQELQTRFNQYYPDFEAISGWAPQGQNDEMSSEIRRFLEDFFRPYNRKLFDMFGIPPFEGWAV